MYTSTCSVVRGLLTMPPDQRRLSCGPAASEPPKLLPCLPSPIIAHMLLSCRASERRPACSPPHMTMRASSQVGRTRVATPQSAAPLPLCRTVKLESDQTSRPAQIAPCDTHGPDPEPALSPLRHRAAHHRETSWPPLASPALKGELHRTAHPPPGRVHAPVGSERREGRLQGGRAHGSARGSGS